MESPEGGRKGAAEIPHLWKCQTRGEIKDLSNQAYLLIPEILAGMHKEREQLSYWQDLYDLTWHTDLGYRFKGLEGQFWIRCVQSELSTSFSCSASVDSWAVYLIVRTAHFLLLFTQVRRFLFLTSSWLQSLYSSILSLLLPSVFIPRNPKQGGKFSISAENHLGSHAVNYFPGCFAVGNEGTSQRMETQPSVYDQLLLFFGFASVSWNYTDVYQSDFILLQVEVNIQ